MKCISRWRVNMYRDENNRLQHAGIQCRTCGLKLKDNQGPTDCGLGQHYAEKTAVYMGTLNRDLWKRRELLDKALAEYKAYTVDPSKANSYDWQKAHKAITIHRQHIRRLMKEKVTPSGHYLQRIEADANMRAIAQANAEPTRPRLFVRIIQATKPTYWYAKRLGEVFEVETLEAGKYADFAYDTVTGPKDPKGEGGGIEADDCILI